MARDMPQSYTALSGGTGHRVSPCELWAMLVSILYVENLGYRRL